VTIAGEHRCTCAACGRRLSSKTLCPFPAPGTPGKGSKARALPHRRESKRLTRLDGVRF
jgi:hypothetical protein